MDITYLVDFSLWNINNFQCNYPRHLDLVLTNFCIFRAIGLQGYSVVNNPEQYLLSNVGTTSPLCNRWVNHFQQYITWNLCGKLNCKILSLIKTLFENALVDNSLKFPIQLKPSIFRREGVISLLWIWNVVLPCSFEDKHIN